VTVINGANLTISPGTFVFFTNGSSLNIGYYGILTANASSSSPITFNFISPNSSSQNGIKFTNSSSMGTINYCKIRGAYRGIYESSVSLNITNSAISGCADGIYLYNSSPVIQACNIYNNSNDGISMLYSSPTVKENYIQNNSTGVYCSTNSDPVIGNSSTQMGNYISSNGYGVIAFNNANPRIGNTSPSIAGYNNLVNYTNNILNTTSNTIYTRNNWWGTTNPSYFLIGGLVSYTPYRTTVVSIPQPALSKSSGHHVASVTENIPMLSELDKAYQFIASNNLVEARNICLNLVNNYPDYSVSYNALNLLKETYTENELAAKEDIYTSLFNKNSKKDLHAMAGLILSDIDKKNKLKQIDEVITAYKGESVIELALFDKLVYYYFELEDGTNARTISNELDEQFPLSEGAVEAHKILGDEKYFNVEPIRKKAYQDSSEQTLTEYSLSDNYPNPFNPVTKIGYTVPQTSFVTLKVYDVLGREVATLVNEEKISGVYEVEFNGSNLSSGIYFYSLTAGDFHQTKKLILMK
jgi:parallel beta-helix repeat protein